MSRNTKGIIAAVIVGPVLVWALAAPALSAHNIISIRTETSYRGLQLLSVLVATYWYTRGRNPSSRFVPFAMPLCLLFLLTATWWYSAQMFAYWKIKAISPDTWSRMAADLQLLAKETSDQAQEGGWKLETGRLPQSFRRLGRESFCRGIAFKYEEEFKCVVAYVYYTNDGRLWGFFMGPREIITQLRTGLVVLQSERIPVGPDIYFFVRASGRVGP